ncbi:hypothetical protein RJ639_047813 [Escallonia herrerae]|uniref:Hexosyltransferase n=1 Tax=Escallonia herrerae TaxID=1293975 RepID=A0AA88WCX5_9ASTE|nr:hypothetical protein RJ639_047813 [Escallonia herrerae]
METVVESSSVNVETLTALGILLLPRLALRRRPPFELQNFAETSANVANGTMIFRDLERRIVEAEMELTLAKSQGYLKGQLQQSGSSSGKRLLAVIGVYTGFGSRLHRNVFRGSWMPRGDALKKLEERGVVIRFVIGRSANRGDSLDRNIDEESHMANDFLILDSHEEAQEELPKKAKFFFSTAVQNWDAEFYVKVDDSINLDLDGLIKLLQSRRGQDSAYIGCMKSGEVVSEEDLSATTPEAGLGAIGHRKCSPKMLRGRPWYEPEWWKFGDEKTYFRHAGGLLFILSKNMAQYININSAILKTYAHDDISVGSWMMGLQATYIDDSRLCCGNSGQGNHVSSLLLILSKESCLREMPTRNAGELNPCPCKPQNTQ